MTTFHSTNKFQKSADLRASLSALVGTFATNSVLFLRPSFESIPEQELVAYYTPKDTMTLDSIQAMFTSWSPSAPVSIPNPVGEGNIDVGVSASGVVIDESFNITFSVLFTGTDHGIRVRLVKVSPDIQEAVTLATMEGRGGAGLFLAELLRPYGILYVPDEHKFIACKDLDGEPVTFDTINRDVVASLFGGDNGSPNLFTRNLVNEELFINGLKQYCRFFHTGVLTQDAEGKLDTTNEVIRSLPVFHMLREKLGEFTLPEPNVEQVTAYVDARIQANYNSYNSWKEGLAAILFDRRIIGGRLNDAIDFLQRRFGLAAAMLNNLAQEFRSRFDPRTFKMVVLQSNTMSLGDRILTGTKQWLPESAVAKAEEIRSLQAV